MEMKIFVQIKPRELVNRAWENEKTAPNVCYFKKHTEQLGYWVATEVLVQKSVDRRVKMMQKFYDICEEAYNLKNLNLCITIYCGLFRQQINRLSRLRRLVRENKKYRDLDDKFDNLVCTDHNWANYRT